MVFAGVVQKYYEKSYRTTAHVSSVRDWDNDEQWSRKMFTEETSENLIKKKEKIGLYWKDLLQRICQKVFTET